MTKIKEINKESAPESSPEENIFSTRDIYLASTLVTLKFFMLGVDYMVDGTKHDIVGFFKFEDSSDLQDAKRKYAQGLLLVEPKAFYQTIHSLKSEVSNVYKSPYADKK